MSSGAAIILCQHARKITRVRLPRLSREVRLLPCSSSLLRRLHDSTIELVAMQKSQRDILLDDIGDEVLESLLR